MTDWMELLKQSGEQARQLSSQMPGILASDAITADEAARLYKVVERGAQSCDQLISMMNDADVDDSLLSAAESLEDIWSTLSVAAANKVRSIQGLPMIEIPDDE